MKSDNLDSDNVNDEILTDGDGESEDSSGHSQPRSTNQRRRLLVAALAGAPMIVAGSAQTAYAQSTASFKPSDPATRGGGAGKNPNGVPDVGPFADPNPNPNADPNPNAAF